MKAWKFGPFSWTPASARPPRKPVSETMNSRHVGKAMCASTPDGVTITTECLTCGEVVIGPLHPLHLRSASAMIDQMADALGLPSREDSIHHKTADVVDNDGDPTKAVAEAREKFNSMDVNQIAEQFDQDDAPPHGITSRDLIDLFKGPGGKVH